MKILVIPDVHGTHFWEKAKDKIDDYDKVIMLGDYVDNWQNKWPDQGTNLKKIIAFKTKYPDKVVLLAGNHDTSYYLDEQCSGYQPHHAIDIKDIFNKTWDHFQAIYIEKNYIFAHGGVSSEWMKFCGIKSPHEINELFKTRPNFFRWCGPDGYGRNAGEGVLWIRPEPLVQYGIQGFTQILGHTEHNIAPIILKTVHGDNIILVDQYDHAYLHSMEI